jgi:hypothetical protein
MKNEAKEVEFQNLFERLTARQQDSVLSMEREFAWAARLRSDNVPLPPDASPRSPVRTASGTDI